MKDSLKEMSEDMQKAAALIVAQIKELERNYNMEISNIEIERRTAEISNGRRDTLSIKPIFKFSFK